MVDAPAPAEPVTAAAASTASDRYAHLRVGGCDIAVPAHAVVQAMVPPTVGLTELPRRQGALSGLLDFRGGAIPVVALDRWVELGEASDSAATRIVVLQSGSSLVAIQADALVGVERIDPASVRTVCHGPDDEELFEAVVPATAERRLLCILEVARLVALSSIWCDDADVRPRGLRPLTPGARDATTRFALFAVGNRPWAVLAAAITRFAKAPRPELSWPGRRVCGIGTWEARKVPLVDLAAGGGAAGGAAIGAASEAAWAASADARPWMAVLRAGPDAIGLVVSRGERMLDLAVDEIGPSGSDPLVMGTALVDGIGTVSLLNVDGLFRSVTEAKISRIPVPPPVASPGASRASADPSDAVLDKDDGAYLVFEADRRYASPVAGVLGVAALPAAAIDDLRQGRRATLEWRGQKIGVVAMPGLDGGAVALAPQIAVIVRGARHGEARSAIAVSHLRDWLPVHAARKNGMRWHSAGELTMITAPGGQRNGSMVVVDLAQMAYLLD